MPEPTHAERRARGLDVLEAMTGAEPTAVADRWEAELGALWSYTVDFATGDIWSRSGMSPRDRCFIVICMLATIPEPTLLREYVGYGLNLGLTEEDIEEALIQLAGYAGFARAIAAQRAADEVFAQRRGVDKLPARQAAAILTDEQRRDNVIDVLGQMNKHRKPGEGGVGQRRQGPDPLGTYSRIAARYNWGDAWARGGITPRERSLAVCATLIA